MGRENGLYNRQRVIETIKDGLEAFDVLFPCRCHGKRHIKSLLSLYRAY
jgi:hypothetical protein